MRVIFGLVAAAALAVPSQLARAEPAKTVCLIRGGPSICFPYPKYWAAATGPQTETPGTSGTSLKTIVLQPSAPSGNAWVMESQSSAGATDNAPACSLGLDC